MPEINEAHLTGETRSPFLPGTNIQFAWDSTSLGYLKTCPRLYQYSMIECWGSTDESVHLRFGIEYHKALQDYDIYRAKGDSFAKAQHKVIGELLARTTDFNPSPETKAGKYKNRESLTRTVIWYLEHFQNDPAETFIKSDGTPAVELSFRFELDWGPAAQPVGTITSDEGDITVLAGAQPYLLCGHLDRVVRFNDELFVMDRKTTTTTPGSYYFDQYQPNNQMTLYTIASQVVLEAPVKGVIIDAAQILIDSSRFVRGFTYRTQDQIEEWLTDLGQWLSLAEHFATQGYWPQNDTACDKFGGCRFRDICSKSPNVREQFLRAKFDQLDEDHRWNPLKPR